MKNCLLLFCILSSYVYSQQVRTAVFKDGTKIDYEIYSTDPYDAPRLNVWLFEINARPAFSLGTAVSFTLPNYFYSKMHIGYGMDGSAWTYNSENTIYFKSFTKEKTRSITLQSSTTSAGGFDHVTKYKDKLKVDELSQLGVRVGYLTANYYIDFAFNNDVYTGNELSAGFSYTKTKFYKGEIHRSSKSVKGFQANRTSYYAEILYNHNLVGRDKDGFNEVFFYDLDPNFGYRIGLEGQGGGRLGFSYKFGLEKPATPNSFVGLFFGFGCYLSFL